MCFSVFVERANTKPDARAHDVLTRMQMRLLHSWGADGYGGGGAAAATAVASAAAIALSYSTCSAQHRTQLRIDMPDERCMLEHCSAH